MNSENCDGKDLSKLNENETFFEFAIYMKSTLFLD